jgi:hypothetical protein
MRSNAADDGRRRARRLGWSLCGVTIAVASMAGVTYAAPFEPYVPPPELPAPPAAPGAVKVSPAFRHEVWAIDQSNTAATSTSNGQLNHGGRIHIYDADALRTQGASAPVEVIELAGATSALCRTQTAVNPVRPHMAAMTRSGSHAIVSFVASGHVVIFDAATRAPLRCFRTETGSGGAVQAHAAVLTPDERFILVANQNGKKVERIAVDFAAGVFVQEPSATIDLANGFTPNGALRQDPALRPDNAPICAFVPSSGFPAYVSLRGGGMLALDPYATPMSIVAEYDATAIAGDGCGFAEGNGWVVGNGGSNPNKLNGWFVYRLPVAGRDMYQATNLPNTPAVEVLDTDATGPRDSHGGAVTGGGKYVWVFDRVAHVAEVFEMKTGAKVNTLNLRSSLAGQPAIDIATVSPDGRFIYATTRGPQPLSGAHAAKGTNPGVVVIELLQDGRSGVIRGLAPISNLVVEPTGAVERGDPHGIIVRRTSTPAPRATKFERRRVVGAAPSAEQVPAFYCQI